MDERFAARLRELINDYYHGLLTVESYREQRAALLDTLDAPPSEAREVTEELEDPTVPVAVTPVAPSTPADDSAVPVATVGPRSGEGWLGRLAVAGIVGVGLATVVGIQQLSGPSSDEPPATASAPAELAPEEAAGEALLEQFLAQGDWAQDSVSNFELAWGVLTEADRDVARSSASYRRFSDVLRRRLLEEQALTVAGRTPELLALLNFAVSMDMPYAESLQARTAPGEQGPSQVAPEVLADPSAEPAPVADAESPVEAEVEVLVEAVPEAPVEAVSEEAPAETEPEALAEAVREAPETVTGGGPQDVVETAPSEPQAAPSQAEDTCLAEFAKTRRPYCQDRMASGGVGPPMVILPTGEFDMGSDQNPEESPKHRVSIVQPFAMSVHEVSYVEFGAYCSATGQPCPQRPWENDDYPVVLISWSEASGYSAWLSNETGYRYRLPTEAEWEYAARAGSESPYPFGSEITPSAARSSATVPVEKPLDRNDRSVNRNDFRLLHMSGNVREWVADAWHGSYQAAPADASAWEQGSASQRVVRGGSYADPGRKLRSAARQPLDASSRDSMTGFRLVRHVER